MHGDAVRSAVPPAAAGRRNRGPGAFAPLVERQRQLAHEVRRTGPGIPLRSIRRVAGVDVSYDGDRGVAAAILLSFPDLVPLEAALHVRYVDIPYIPGLLSFREMPPVLPALRALPRPDVVVVDGSGVLHPRGFGFASHLGVATGIPTIGFTKTRLAGQVEGTPRPGGGAVRVLHQSKVGGYAFVPAGSKNPVYVSVGHRVSPRFALALVKRCMRTRLPEPVRLADRASRMMRKGASRQEIATVLGLDEGTVRLGG